MTKFISILLAALTLSSCNEYQKALKNDEVSKKYAVSIKMYEAKKYSKAIRLFEQIVPLYRGKPQAENMFFMYSQSLYKTEQFYAAGYQFESFASSYPKSSKVEEASYLSAICYTEMSPNYSLDQVDTNKAIDKLQRFIDDFPNSTYLSDANSKIKILREKLEKKAFEVAKQYNTIADYKAALVALDNFLIDFPGTPFKEKALYYKFDSAYNLAINSVNSKMKERLDNAKIASAALLKFNANTEYKSKVDIMLAKIETDLKQFSK